MNYIQDLDMTVDEAIEYVNRCSARQVGDTRAFLEILRLTRAAYTDSGAHGEEEPNCLTTFAKIADICKERLRE